MRADPILETLIDVVELRHADGKHPLNIRLMVHVGGIFICGIVVAEGEFMAQNKPFLNVIHESRSEATLDAAVDFDIAPSSLKSIQPKFLHLARACFAGPTGDWDPPGDTSIEYWRGRLTSIDGFTLGESFIADSRADTHDGSH